VEPQPINAEPSPGRIAGIDYGTVRIGVAVSDAGRTLASPLETRVRGSEEADAEYFRQLVDGEEIRLFVVGLPIHLSGRESDKSREARRFGQWLAQVTGVPVEYFDERFSSRQADEFLQAGGLTRRRRKKRRDMLAAQVMLAAYLDASRHGRQDVSGLDD
jgi:putative Holliday junction resolvase